MINMAKAWEITQGEFHKLRETHGDDLVGIALVWWDYPEDALGRFPLPDASTACVGDPMFARCERLAELAHVELSESGCVRTSLKSGRLAGGSRYMAQVLANGEIVPQRPVLIVAHIDGAPVSKSLARWMDRIGCRILECTVIGGDHAST